MVNGPRLIIAKVGDYFVQENTISNNICHQYLHERFKHHLLTSNVVKILISVAANVAQDPPSTSKLAPRPEGPGKNGYQAIPLSQSTARTNEPAVFC